MSGVPRSQTLIATMIPDAGTSAAWVTPANTVTLIKSFNAFYSGAGTAYADLAVGGGSPNISGILIRLTLASGGNASWEGFIALNPTYGIYVNTTAGPLMVFVSGAVLQGAPLYPVASRDVPSQQPHGLAFP